MQSILHSIIGPSGPETADLTGKVALVTGGPMGIVSRSYLAALGVCLIIGPERI